MEQVLEVAVAGWGDCRYKEASGYRDFVDKVRRSFGIG